MSNNNGMGQSYEQYSISNKSFWAHDFKYPIVMRVNISRYTRIGHQPHPLKAKDMIKEKVIEIDKKKKLKKLYAGLSIANESSWARKFKGPIVSSVCTPWMRWNRSSTASLEGIRLDQDLSSIWCLIHFCIISICLLVHQLVPNSIRFTLRRHWLFSFPSSTR